MTDQLIPTVALVDVAGIFRAMWSVTGDHTALAKTVERVRSIRAQHDHCAICADSPPYRRSKISADYKAQREKPGAPMLDLYVRTKQALADEGLPILAADGYEADDVIASLTEQLVSVPVAKRVAVVVVSADKDLMQLVSDAKLVSVFNWSTGARYDEAAVEAEFRVKPSKIRELLALAGDSTDNIPGVKNVGRVTAAIAVNSGPGLEGAMAGEFIKGVLPKAADAIANSRDLVKLSLDLATLEANAPVSADEIFAKREPRRRQSAPPPPRAPEPSRTEQRAKPVAPPPVHTSQLVTHPEGPRVELVPAQDWGIGVPVEHLVRRVEKIKEVQAKVMKLGHHYGTVPGTGNRLTLLKPGAEMLTLAFQLDPQFEVKDQWSGDHLESLVTCLLYHAPTGVRVGSGIGSCSTRESKYSWRKGERRCPQCKQTAIIKGKEEYGGGWVCYAKKSGCNAKFHDRDPAIIGQNPDRIANADLPDCWNTVRKMACKRAHVAAILFTTGASELFTQDVEDNDEPTAQDDWEAYYRQQQRGAA